MLQAFSYLTKPGIIYGNAIITAGQFDFKPTMIYNCCMDIELIKQKTAPIFAQYHIHKASVFGSVARGQDTAQSDVDFLIEPIRPFGLIKLVGLKQDLEETLKKPVDVVEYGAIKPAFANNILNDSTIIYEQ